MREAELLEDLADRALVVSDAEALGHDLLQVHPARKRPIWRVSASGTPDPSWGWLTSPRSGRALGADYEVDNRIAHLLLGNCFLRRNGVKPDAPKRVGIVAIDRDRQLTAIFRQLDFWRI